MTNGDRAALRHAAKPSDMELLPGLYRLFPGLDTVGPHHRIAYLLPYARHATNAKSLGVQLAAARISETRLLQVARSDSPTDIELLRRLLRQLDTALDWKTFGGMLWHWNEHSKRQLVKAYYLAKFTPAKGA
ncbi:MAG: type I-E CRISPR-associated protein Cse2/CasB [Xanthomonadaceae bacterium]|nr:type I-E CRISPR-associated protein Cse2/CasB [Xanthomonadaceae bacterium]MDP2184454.1 type I-E CRISPR-associated protein Cse2/CasB [Xanthomonadales bacterium]MDZ4114573.1 type I-E CRISPR-associated protein Cse2/CasB [Xanthomonadaceae bacterium]MDZ4377980.1 type I-E CRISPR-associated protein Cse2/CasB [Xanthomonadaceae bacterium]